MNELIREGGIYTASPYSVVIKGWIFGANNGINDNPYISVGNTKFCNSNKSVVNVIIPRQLMTLRNKDA